MTQQLTWRKAIEKVLSEASGAVHYKDLTDKNIEARLRTDLGATPAATVSAHLTTALKKEGANCPWQKIGRGLYVWKAKAGITQQAAPPALPEEDEAEEKQYAVVSSFGMFWRREAVEWSSNPKILGMQQTGAEPVAGPFAWRYAPTCAARSLRCRETRKRSQASHCVGACGENRTAV
jgi:hypothetical protein